MKDFSLVAITTGLVLVACIGFTVVTAYEVPPAELDGWVSPARKTMRAFRSDSELRSYFRAIAERQRRLARREGAGGVAGVAGLVDMQSSPALKSAPQASARRAKPKKRKSL